MFNFLIKATRFATEAHHGQTRKYTLEPYINHPIRVADKLLAAGEGDEELLAAALLHDTIEDCGVTYDEIKNAFNGRVADLVYEVTNPSQLPGAAKGNRQFRKEMDFQHVAKASREGKVIKLADLIDNSESIFRYDPHFGTVYAVEKRRMMGVLIGANETLYTEADFLLQKWEAGGFKLERSQAEE